MFLKHPQHNHDEHQYAQKLPEDTQLIVSGCWGDHIWHWGIFYGLITIVFELRLFCVKKKYFLTE